MCLMIHLACRLSLLLTLFCGTASASVFQKVSAETLPSFADAGERQQLISIVEMQLKYFDSRKVPSRFLNWNGHPIAENRVRDSLVAFSNLIKLNIDQAELKKRIAKKFDVFRVTGNKSRILFTGYYAPTFEARLKKSPEFSWPIHKKSRGVKGISRSKINAGALEGKGLEVAWMKRVDRFILQLQGSGQLVFENGKHTSATFSGHNGFEFRGIGTIMKEEGVIIRTKPWIKGLREYFEKHPEKMDHFFHQQQRYVFFKLHDRGPTGMAGIATGVEGYQLTPRRSVATDQNYYPIGAILWGDYRQPVRKADGTYAQNTTSQFFINQDTGGPLRGSHRVDIFYGSGPEAGRVASSQHDYGSMYMLLLPTAK